MIEGRRLRPFRWWQALSRSSRFIDLGHPPRRYVVDVRHARRFFAEDGRGRADLYVDGTQAATSKMPARFPAPGGVIEVCDSAFGLRRCTFVADGGGTQALAPDPRSAEGRRARLAIRHPAVSRVVAAASVLVLVVGIGLNLLQLAEPLSAVPPIRDSVGQFHSPIVLPVWLNLILAAGAVLASTERALRLRYSVLLDLAGN